MTSRLVAGVPPAGTVNPHWWKAFGACVGEDPVLFFPTSHESLTEPKRICATCPVQDECLEYALGNNDQHGIWGGKSIHERRKIREARCRARLASVPAAAARAAGAVPSVARDLSMPTQLQTASVSTSRAAHP